MPELDPVEYFEKMKKRIQRWKNMLAIAKAMIEAQEEAGIPTLAVWNRYQLIAARIEALEKAVDKALEELKKGE